MKILVNLCFVLTLLGISNYSNSQTRNYGKEADAYWEAGLWAKAAPAYKKASAKIVPKSRDAANTKAKYAYRSAESYRLMRIFEPAEEQYKKAVLLKYFKIEPKVYYYLGEMQMAQGKHDRAEISFKKYKELNTGDPLADIRLESCQNYRTFEREKGRQEMKPMSKLNTTKFDYGAVMDSRGMTMYFSSSRPSATGDETDDTIGEDFTDIFLTKIDRKGNFSEPIPLKGGINTTNNEGAICFDGRGRKMFFTRCIVSEKNLGCDIYVALKKGDSYTKAEKIHLKDHDSTNVGQPCVSPDGKTLIFASDMAGGEGGVDLWQSVYDTKLKEWSLPINMGPEINTPGNDMFPTWGPNDALYYASDGMVGAGGLDIFRAEKKTSETEWENPTNIGAPLNSYSDDYHIIFTQNSDGGSTGYISSNRPGSKKSSKSSRSQDIWSFYSPPALICCTIEVVDQSTDKVVPNVDVKVTGSDGSSFILKSDEKGIVELCEKEDGSRFITPDNIYSIEIQDIRNKWIGTRTTLSTKNIKEPTNFHKEVGIINIEQGPIRIPEIRFEFGTMALIVDKEINSKDSLKYIYDLMVSHPNIVVQIIANTDSRGTAEYNKLLSQKRAEVCVKYLIEEKGISQQRLKAYGQGEDNPIMYHETNSSGDTIFSTKLTEEYINQFVSNEIKFETLHQLNRRTEAQIISFDYLE